MQSDSRTWGCLEFLRLTKILHTVLPEEVDLKLLDTMRRDGVSRLKGCIALLVTRI